MQHFLAHLRVQRAVSRGIRLKDAGKTPKNPAYILVSHRILKKGDFRLNNAGKTAKNPPAYQKDLGISLV